MQLVLDDRRGNPRRRGLPQALWVQEIAAFLRFDDPVPNMLYAFGGRNQSRGPLDLVEMFDTWHGRWVTCPSMPARRAGSTAATLPDGRIAVVGGYNEGGIAKGLLTSCDVYDPVAQRWEEPGTMAPLLRGRWGHGCAVLDGKIYIVGGCSLMPGAQPREAFMETLKSCEVYDPSTNRWTSAAPLNIARSGCRVVALASGRHMVAVGGCDDVFGRAETQATVEMFDLSTGKWSRLQSRLSKPRTTAAAVAVGDQQLLVVGGAPSLACGEMLEVSLTPDEAAEEAPAPAAAEDEAKRLAQVADMAEGRMGCHAALVNLPAPGSSYPLSNRRCAVVVGGERCRDMGGDGPVIKQFKSVSIFDLESNAWREDDLIPEMSVSRTAAALCVGIGRVSA